MKSYVRDEVNADDSMNKDTGWVSHAMGAMWMDQGERERQA